MRTTTVVRNSFELTYPSLDPSELDAKFNAHLEKTQSVLEAFLTAHGITSDNLVSQSEGDTRITVRSWPDLATAQAWVDTVLSGATVEGLDHPAIVVSAQVDPE